MELGDKNKNFFIVLKFLLKKGKSYLAGFGFASGLPQERAQPGLPLAAQASVP